jgi:hypothetical protein
MVSHPPLTMEAWIPESVHVGFVVHKVALQQVFLWVLQFFPANIIPLWLSIALLIYHLGDEQ